jgi:hypothetical protein
MTLPSNAKRPFNYHRFIEKLKLPIDRAFEFKDEELHEEHGKFREWRHELKDLIADIERLKYRVNSNVAGRVFTKFSSDRDANDTVFRKDWIDTISELELVVKKYDEYGDPRESETPTSTCTPVASIPAKQVNYGDVPSAGDNLTAEICAPSCTQFLHGLMEARKYDFSSRAPPACERIPILL